MIGRLMMIGWYTRMPEQNITASEPILSAIRELKPGGVVLLRRNIPDSANKLRELIASLRAAADWPIIIAVDQEGGSVTRIPESAGVDAMPPNAQVKDCALAFSIAKQCGTQLKELGFDINLAPVADTASEALGDRCFDGGPETVARLVSAAIAGYKEAGIACCAKHFPGLGGTTEDTHHTLTNGMIQLEPFRAAIKTGVDALMTAHAYYPEIDRAYPATLSKPVIDLARTELKFDGLIITDSLEMRAIEREWFPSQAAGKAIQAGVDMVLVPHSRKEQDATKRWLQNQLDNGLITEDQVAQSIRRITAIAGKG